jgi:hypothetical protein
VLLALGLDLKRVCGGQEVIDRLVGPGPKAGAAGWPLMLVSLTMR